MAAPDDRRVLRPLLLHLVHALGGAGEQGLHVEARHGGGEQPDGGEHREASPHVGGDGEHAEVLALGYLLEEALVRVRGGDGAPLVAEGA